jgi:hypothetical protein
VECGVGADVISSVDLRKSVWKQWQCSVCDGLPSAVLSVDTSGMSDELAKKIDAILLRLNALDTISKSVHALDARMTALEAIINRIAILETTTAELTQQNKSLVAETTKLTTTVQQLLARIDQLEIRTTQVEQYSRARNLLIKGVPSRDGENVMNIIMRTLQVLGVQARVIDGHRLSHTTVDSSIIAVFESKRARNEVLFARIKRKHLYVHEVLGDSIPSASEVSVTEHLCETVERLFWRAKQNASQLGFSQCFTYNGQVYFRQEKGAQKVLIGSQSDLLQKLQAAGKADIYVDRSRRR